MKNNSTKRIALRFCTPDVIELIDLLPRGFKSMIVESALTAYLNSEIGKMLIDQLTLRKNQGRSLQKTPAPREDVVFNRLKGDF